MLEEKEMLKVYEATFTEPELRLVGACYFFMLRVMRDIETQPALKAYVAESAAFLRIAMAIINQPDLSEILSRKFTKLAAVMAGYTLKEAQEEEADFLAFEEEKPRTDEESQAFLLARKRRLYEEGRPIGSDRSSNEPTEPDTGTEESNTESDGASKSFGEVADSPS